MKLGLIRCQQTEDMCPATTCLKVINNKKLAFNNVEEYIELVGINSCGGCPGKKIITRIDEMIKRGASAIAFASCIKKGTPIGFPCPFHEKFIQLVQEKYKDLEVIDWTH